MRLIVGLIFFYYICTMKTFLLAFAMFILFVLGIRVWNTFDPYVGFGIMGGTIYLTYLLILKPKKKQNEESNEKF